ncbi:ribonuclease E/G [Salmonella enterica subsp. enterica]|nr:ribonuclease E/G [Salmonella enterica subsp. enterica]
MPSRYLCLCPASHAGVSQRIESESERERPGKGWWRNTATNRAGFIIRTAAEGVCEE